MKKILAGGFLALTGSIWALAFIVIAGNNLTSEFEELRKKAGVSTPTWDSLRTDSRMEER